MNGTEERLIESAVSLFSHSWYGTVSVAAICRKAGLSNGVFYRYFDGKEALFRKILEQVLSMIREAVAEPGGSCKRDRIRSLVQAVVSFSRDHRELVTVFREGQYRFFEYERRLDGNLPAEPFYRPRKGDRASRIPFCRRRRALLRHSKRTSRRGNPGGRP